MAGYLDVAWRQQLRDASFRGVAFRVDDHRLAGGRRIVSFEFPQRDEPQVQDLGRKQRQYSITAYVLGEDYFGARDALLDALEAGGTGTLVHPYLGELSVQVGDFDLSETTADGGMAVFKITFMQDSKLVYPAASSGTSTAAGSAADTAATENQSAFASAFSVANLADWVSSKAAAAVQDVIDTITGITELAQYPAEMAAQISDQAQALSAAVSELILTPVTLASELDALIAVTVDAATSPIDALETLDLIFDSTDTGTGTAPAEAATSDASDVAVADNSNALDTLVAVSAVAASVTATSAATAAGPSTSSAAATTAQAAIAVSEQAASDGTASASGSSASSTSASSDIAGFSSADEALARRNRIVEQIDLILERDVSDDLYAALVSMRAAATRDLTERAAQLPRIDSLRLSESMPALALAWSLYQDASRADEICARNSISNPLFAPAGVPLEVLAS